MVVPGIHVWCVVVGFVDDLDSGYVVEVVLGDLSSEEFAALDP